LFMFDPPTGFTASFYTREHDEQFCKQL
jgi:hypothetical protein